MKSITKNSIWLFLVAALIGMPASAFAVTFLIGSEDIQIGAVQTDHIAPYAITNDKIATSTITQDKLAFTLPGGSKYANVVVVAKSGGDFTDPIAAVNSITDASVDKPYLVKIMPGIYSLGTSSLQMKEYVDAEGSGPGNTVIISSNNGTDMCTIGTVVMANHTSIRNIKIVNSAPNLNGDYGSPVAALVFDNVEAKAEGVDVLTGSDTVAGGLNNGICTNGESAHAILNNVYVEAHNYKGQTNPIMFGGGKITLTNSKVTGFHGNGGWVQVINNNSRYLGTVTVINSILEGTSTGTVTGLTSDGSYEAFVSNSIITLHGGSENSPIHGIHTLDFFMENTRIVSDGAPVSYDVSDGSVVRIANSRLPGDRTRLEGAKLVNCYNENYDAIPNQ
jgi:hypothetical protein